MPDNLISEIAPDQDGLVKVDCGGVRRPVAVFCGTYEHGWRYAKPSPGALRVLRLGVRGRRKGGTGTPVAKAERERTTHLHAAYERAGGTGTPRTGLMSIPTARA